MLPGGVVVRIQGSYCHNQGLIPGQGSLSSSSLPAAYQPPPCDHTTPLDFPGVSDSKECSCNAGDLSLIPGFGRSPREGNCYPLQYSGLENSMDYIVHGVPKSTEELMFLNCGVG